VTIGNQVALLLPGVALASPAQGVPNRVRWVDPLASFNISRDI
jgi:hypothetical protein